MVHNGIEEHLVGIKFCLTDIVQRVAKLISFLCTNDVILEPCTTCLQQAFCEGGLFPGEKSELEGTEV